MKVYLDIVVNHTADVINTRTGTPHTVPWLRLPFATPPAGPSTRTRCVQRDQFPEAFPHSPWSAASRTSRGGAADVHAKARVA